MKLSIFDMVVYFEENEKSQSKGAPKERFLVKTKFYK